MTDQKEPETLDDANLDAAGGVYVQEVPSSARPGRNAGVVLFFDEADGIKQPENRWAVFEPNGER